MANMTGGTKQGEAVCSFKNSVTPLNADMPSTKPNSAKLLARQFCEETTAHGFGSFIRQSSLIGKTCWAVIITAAILGSVQNFSYVVLGFMEYKTQETASLSYDAAPFPDVTVCNLQAASQEGLDQHRLYLQSFHSTVENIKASANEMGIVWESVEDQALSPYTFLENQGLAAARAVGHQQNNFILRCSFAGQPCGSDDFTYFMDPTYYNCFTFRPNFTEDTKTLSIGAGPTVGLSLIVYLEANSASLMTNPEVHQSVYDDDSSFHNALGAKVTIHEKGSLPLTVDTGLDVMPGQSTSFAVSTEEYVRLDKPYGDCTKEETLSGLDDFAYSPSGCLHICIQRYIWEKCGCTSSYFSVPDDLRNVKFCGTFNSSDSTGYFQTVECQRSKWLEFTSSSVARKQCQCRSPCHEYSYDAVSSQSKWPADKYVEDFYHDIVIPSKGAASREFKNITPTNTTYFAGLVRANFARINVYFKSLSVKSRVQEPSLNWPSLFSSLGGVMGLWGGISIITVTEMAVFVVRLLVSFCIGSTKN